MNHSIRSHNVWSFTVDTPFSLTPAEVFVHAMYIVEDAVPFAKVLM
jgi:hypothetical protein